MQIASQNKNNLFYEKREDKARKYGFSVGSATR